MSEDEAAYLREFGARILIGRRRKGWNQSQLAQRAGVTNVQISRIERGQVKTSIIRIRLIKAALDMEWKELFPDPL